MGRKVSHKRSFILKFMRNSTFRRILGLQNYILQVSSPAHSFLQSGRLVGLHQPLQWFNQSFYKKMIKLDFDMSMTITATFWNSKMYAYEVPTCLMCSKSWKEISGSLWSNLSLTIFWWTPRRWLLDHGLIFACHETTSQWPHHQDVWLPTWWHRFLP